MHTARPVIARKMVEHTLSDLKYINREALASKVRAKDEKLAVIDVRDSDYIGGHILTAQNVPTSTHDYRMPELVRSLKDKDVVVFHCALSQVRGPKSALLYLRERERIQNKGELAARQDGTDVSKSQKVYVLDGGFTKWQEKSVTTARHPKRYADSFRYGPDTEVTEDYRKELWQDY